MRVLEKPEIEKVAGGVVRGSETMLTVVLTAQSRRGSSMEGLRGLTNRAKAYYRLPTSQRKTLNPNDLYDGSILEGAKLLRRAGWVVY